MRRRLFINKIKKSKIGPYSFYEIGVDNGLQHYFTFVFHKCKI